MCEKINCATALWFYEDPNLYFTYLICQLNALLPWYMCTHAVAYQWQFDYATINNIMHTDYGMYIECPSYVCTQ